MSWGVQIGIGHFEVESTADNQIYLVARVNQGEIPWLRLLKSSTKHAGDVTVHAM